MKSSACIVLVLLVGLSGANGLKCYTGCTGAGCETAVADMSMTCEASYDSMSGSTTAACLKMTAPSEDGKTMQTSKACGAADTCETLKVLMELAKAFDDGSDPATSKAMKEIKCASCSSDHCNNTSGPVRAGGVWTFLLASVVTLVTVHN